MDVPAFASPEVRVTAFSLVGDLNDRSYGDDETAWAAASLFCEYLSLSYLSYVITTRKDGHCFSQIMHSSLDLSR
jgi:hypothetical protein